MDANQKVKVMVTVVKSQVWGTTKMAKWDGQACEVPDHIPSYATMRKELEESTDTDDTVVTIFEWETENPPILLAKPVLKGDDFFPF